MLAEYRTVAQEAEITLIEKKSKFIARIKPVQTREEAEAFLEEVRKEHWNATHNVPAYIIGMNQEIQKYSDDNEPSGTRACQSWRFSRPMRWSMPPSWLPATSAASSWAGEGWSVLTAEQPGRR